MSLRISETFYGSSSPVYGVVGHFSANMAHMRQSRPDSGLAFKVKVLKIIQVVPSSEQQWTRTWRWRTCRRLAVRCRAPSSQPSLRPTPGN